MTTQRFTELGGRLYPERSLVGPPPNVEEIDPACGRVLARRELPAAPPIPSNDLLVQHNYTVGEISRIQGELQKHRGLLEILEPDRLARLLAPVQPSYNGAVSARRVAQVEQHLREITHLAGFVVLSKDGQSLELIRALAEQIRALAERVKTLEGR